MVSSGNKTEEVLATYSAQADAVIRVALEAYGDLPMYGMLRYFLGYTDEHLRPTTGVAGKRIRSSLVLLIADMFGGAKSAQDLAIAIELFHNFTLIHDDIEDNDAVRRGRPTVWKLWGVNHAINAGDAQMLIVSNFLLRATSSGENGARATRELNTYFLEVVEGQYLDFMLTEKSLTDPSVTVDMYLEMIRKKTSVLVGAATVAGGLAAGCDTVTRDTLFTYGESLGMAYQIADDMASLWGETKDTGKRAHGDLHERKKTYPILYARDHGVSEQFRARYGDVTPLNEKETQELVVALSATGAREATRALGKKYVARAQDAAQSLPISLEHRTVLAELVDTLVRLAPDNHATD